ncbi:hypothetical protein [Dyella kyungheensis]|uniref:Uncharacterized protein n=1 Tax=Dyella kyungheensis TaxID=1242174 RepID=A0ABS2JL34_9GAMM|nr:hypothetical protein [Dyella kyungheensis]MBM7119747.1 hypothetical protein [Dyella kyungheensis]
MPMTMLAAEAVSEERMPTSPREGRDALYKALAELRWVGYVVQVRSQDAKGRWKTETYIYDTPQSPKTGKPDPVEPGPGEPNFGNAVCKSSKSTSDEEHQ